MLKLTSCVQRKLYLTYNLSFYESVNVFKTLLRLFDHPDQQRGAIGLANQWHIDRKYSGNLLVNSHYFWYRY